MCGFSWASADGGCGRGSGQTNGGGQGDPLLGQKRTQRNRSEIEAQGPTFALLVDVEMMPQPRVESKELM